MTNAVTSECVERQEIEDMDEQNNYSDDNGIDDNDDEWLKKSLIRRVLTSFWEFLPVLLLEAFLYSIIFEIINN